MGPSRPRSARPHFVVSPVRADGSYTSRIRTDGGPPARTTWRAGRQHHQMHLGPPCGGSAWRSAASGGRARAAGRRRRWRRRRTRAGGRLAAATDRDDRDDALQTARRLAELADGAPVIQPNPAHHVAARSHTLSISGQRLVAAMRPPKRSQQHMKAHRLQDPRGSQRAQQAEFTSGSFPDVWAVPRRIDVDSITITHVLHPPLQRSRSQTCAKHAGPRSCAAERCVCRAL